MSNPQDILNTYLNNTPAPQPNVSTAKQQSVLTAAQQKQANLGGNASYGMGAATLSGDKTFISDNEAARDVVNLTVEDLYAKYGNDAADRLLLQKQQGLSQYSSDMNTSRTGPQFVGDTANKVLSGAIGSVGGVASLGAGIVSDKAGMAVGNATNAITQALEGYTSPASQAHSKAMSTRNSNAEAVNRNQYIEDVESGMSQGAAKTKRVFSDIGAAIGNVIQDPTMLSDLTAQGIGSMATIPLLGGPIGAAGKIIKGATGLSGSRIAASVLGANRKAVKVGELLEQSLKGGLAIGAMESGGVYTQVIAELQQMDTAQLLKTSPEFAELVKGNPNTDPEELRTSFLNSVATEAAAKQFIPATLAGLVVGKFELNPTKFGSALGSLSKVGTETVEEGLQSGAGQYAANTTIKDRVDSSRDELGGVGIAAGEGAIAGMGMAGVMQAPSVAASGIVATGKGAKALGGKILDAADKVAEQGALENEKSSATSDEAIIQQSVDLKAKAEAMRNEPLPVVEPVAKGEGDESPTFDVADADVEAFINDANSNMSMGTDEDKVQMSGNSKLVLKAAQSSNTVPEFLLSLSREIDSDEHADTEKLFAASMLAETLDAFSGDVTLGSKLRDSGRVGEKTVEYIDALSNTFSAIQSNSTYNKVLANAETIIAKAREAAPLDEANPTQESVDVINAAANLSPESVDGETAGLVLRMAKQGKVKLSQKQQINLEAIEAIHAAAKAADEIARVSNSETSRVGQQIKTKSEDPMKLSAMQHYDRVRKAINAKDLEQAKDSLRYLGLFVTHMNNKVGALNKSFELGRSESKNEKGQTIVGQFTKVPYWSLNPLSGDFFEDATTVLSASLSTKGGHQMNLNVGAEAKFVGDTYNAIVKAYPELGLPEMEVASLHEGITGKPASTGSSTKKTQQTEEAVQDEVPESFKQSLADYIARATTLKELNAEIAHTKKVDYTPAEKDYALAELEKAKVALREKKAAEAAAKKEAAAQAKADMAAARKAKQEQAKADREKAKAEKAEAKRRAAEAEANKQQAEDQNQEEELEEDQDDSFVTEERKRKAQEAYAARQQATAEQQEPVQEEVNPALGTMGKIFGNLFGGIKNKFYQTFKPRKQENSNIAHLSGEAMFDGLLDLIQQKFNDQTIVDKFAGLFSEYGAFKDYVESHLNSEKLLNIPLKLTSAKDSERITVREAFEQGRSELLAQYPNTRILAVADYVDGKVVLNDKVMRAAYLATLDWSLNGITEGVALNAKRVSEVLNIPEEDVTSEHMWALTVGDTRVAAVNSVVGKLAKYLDISPNNSELQGYTKGILEAIAGISLATFKTKGAMEVFEGEPTTMVSSMMLSLSEDGAKPKNLEILIPIGSKALGIEKHAGAIEAVATKTPDILMYFEDDPIKVPNTQLNNPLAPLTKKQKVMIENQNKTKYYPTTHMVELYEMLGLDTILNLFGEGVLVKEQMNESDYNSKSGRNLGISGAFAVFQEMMFGYRNVAEDMDTTYDKVGMKFGHAPTSVGRSQQLGRYNYQSSKLIRSAIAPTRSIPLDLVGNETHIRYYMLGLAQLLGVKIHNMPPDASIAELEKRLNGKYANVVAELEKFHRTGKMDVAVLLNKDNSLVGNSFEAFQALAEYAKYKNTADKSSYVTDIYIEADGMTNGPFNAKNMLDTASFQAEGLQVLAKGGLYLGGDKDTRNSWFQRTQVDKVDTYEAVSSKFVVNLIKLKDYLRKGNQAANKALSMAQDIEHLLKVFLPDLVITDEKGNTVYQRGISKNPVTISIYGSSNYGIAGKITNVLLEAINARATDAIRRGLGKPDIGVDQALFPNLSAKEAEDAWVQMYTALNNITQSEVFISRDIKTKIIKFVEINEGSPYTFYENMFDFKGLKKLKLQADQRKALVSNINNLMVTPMADAMDEVFHQSVKLNSAQIIKSTRMMHIIAGQIYKAEVVKLLAKKAEIGEPVTAGYISKAEEAIIIRKLGKLMPTIYGANQLFLLGSRDSGKLPVNLFAESPIDRFSIEASGFAPGDIGVAAAPSMVIGHGDAAMILEAYQDPKNTERSSGIFDGVNIPIDDIQRMSEVMNESAHSAIMNNPLRSVEETLFEFNLALAKYLKEAADRGEEAFEIPFEVSRAMSAAIAGKGKLGDNDTLHTITKDNVVGYFTNQHADMFSLANRIDAKHAALGQAEHSLDQMAAAGTPYHVSGTTDFDWSQASLDTIAKQLNDLANKEYERIRAEMQTKRGISISHTKALEEIPKNESIQSKLKIGRLHGSGARVLNSNNINSILKTLRAGKARDLVNTTILKNADFTDYKIIYGNLNELRAYNDSLGSEGVSSAELDTETLGWTFPDRKEIWMVNPTKETLIHELLHAATAKLIVAYYRNPASLNDDAKEAIESITELMNDFLAVDISAEKSLTDEARETVDYVRRALVDLKSEETTDGSIAAVSEFISWGLANQDIIKLNQKKTTSYSLWGILEKSLKLIQRLLGLEDKGSANSIFNNLLFQTSRLVVEGSKSEINTTESASVLRQSALGSTVDERLRAINDMMTRKVTSYLNVADAQLRSDRTKESQEAEVNANTLLSIFQNAGFGITSPDEQATFLSVMTALGTQADLNPASMVRMQELYTQTMKELTPESFRENEDPNDLNDAHQGLEAYNAIAGKTGTFKDAKGRSTLLPAFMALALTNERFKKVLSQIAVPRTDKSPQSRKFDAFLEDNANHALDLLSDTLTGTRKAANIDAAISMLTNRLLELEHQRESAAQAVIGASGSFIDSANEKVRGQISKVASVVETALDNRRAAGKDQRGLSGLLNNAVSMVAAYFEKGAAAQNGEAMMQVLNSAPVPKIVHEIMSDLIGRLDSNASIYDLVKKVRFVIQRLRNHYRVEIPKLLAKQFKTKPTDKEWKAINNTLGKSELISLVLNKHYSSAEVMDLMVNKNQRLRVIRSLEKAIQQEDAKYASEYLNKATQLAEFMMTGSVGSNLQRNATAIAKRAGTKGATDKASETLVANIDSLVSLYAYEAMETSERDQVADLTLREPEGMEFLFGYAKSLLQEERNKANSINTYKGYMPKLQRESNSLVLVDNREHAKMLAKSYVKVGDYSNSNLDITKPSMSYYYAPVKGKAMFNQGVLQNIRQTAGGIDVLTEQTTNGMTGGIIRNPVLVRRISQAIASGRSEAGSNLMPVFDVGGQVIAYERSVDPSIASRIQYEEDYAKVVGAWKGHVVEEALAIASNQVSIEKAGEMYSVDMKSAVKAKQYVNLLDPKVAKDNPVIADALKLLTPATRKAIEAEFGEDRLMVRKELIENFIGVRSASVTDAWTGVSYWSPKTLDNIRKLATAAFGNNAFRYLAQGEDRWGNVIKDAKTIIIVKSVIVPVANILSNFLQLVARGVPMRVILSSMPKILAEVRHFNAQEKRLIEVEGQLFAATEPLKVKRLENEIQSIKDGYTRLSIWPLIERGELSSMSDDAQPEDVDLTSGRLSAYFEKLVDKLPPQISTMGKYALITKDTALYKGLRKSVEYGDFIAKAILWQDLTRRQGKTLDEANAIITEEYVNYDIFGGRNRQYLESMGLVWFWNYKVRSVKVALSILRNNPLHALLAGVLPIPDMLSVGSPLSDNLITKIAAGDIGYSIGLSQLLNTPQLHPTAVLTGL